MQAAGGVPVLGPLFLGGLPDDDSVYVVVRQASRSGYDVVLGATPSCSGASYCRIGRLTGRRVGAGAPHATGRSVTLAGVGRAVFEESTCGANCSDAVLTWDHGGVRYAIGLKAAELDDFRAVAASVTKLP